MVSGNGIAIVLGKILADGELLPECKKRCDKALELYKAGNISTILLTGGVTEENGKISEAEAMKRYLISFGINENAIILEEKARNTYENAKFCAQILKTREEKTIYLISSEYHMNRRYFNPIRLFKRKLKKPFIPITSEN